MKHQEKHRSEAIGWLRAAVLGANDGLISTSSLIVGVAAAQATRESIILTGCAGLVAGALSMAAGEYVSVSSQADAERADLERERRELATAPDLEHAELAEIYVARGVSPDLAHQVAAQLMTRDALGAHAREELGLSQITRARPLQAALTSAAAFAIGALPPLAIAWLVPVPAVVLAIAAGGLALLAILGAVAARLGGAPLVRGSFRVTFWGACAMAATALVGRLFGAVL
ncbi:MAG TPA: VIT family protein [Thermoanaerobaculia bacterium]|nr:VIT family protein [Thermoanaerobaculia bacterium]